VPPPVSWSFVVNVAAALLMGMAIGLERKWKQHPAGLRTNTLVSLGAALFVSLSLLMDDANSPTRMASYVVSGLGFLGGGVILREGLNVRGLNTAATIWCSGAVGALCGSGFPLHALLGTAAVLGVHLALKPVARWVEVHTKMATDVETYYQLRIESAGSNDAHLRHILLRHVGGSQTLSLQGISTQDASDGRTIILADVYSPNRNDRALEAVVARVSIEPEVKAVSWRRTAA
jgi:putative Mg2+ transporter-C (MgtC) family protein